MFRSTSRAERAAPLHRLGTGLVLLVLLASACAPKVVVGTWTCPALDASPLTSLDVPWTTGFENGFCDYARVGGVCFGDPGTAYQIVDSPVHGGLHAAAFSVISNPANNGTQARCYVQGTLPVAASYGAWFYLPSVVTSASNWNLVHFQGGDPAAWHSLWDVSIETTADGNMSLYVYDDFGSAVRRPQVATPIPVAQWFHVEFRLVRAKDSTGEVALYQDGVLLLKLTGIVTDDTDLGQWFVGNRAGALTPPNFTLYVDDVTMRASP